MVIAINNNTTLKELENAFHKSFPCLKLEFFSKPSNKGKMHTEKTSLNPNAKIGDFCHVEQNTELSISPWQSVKEIEEKFNQLLRLNVQIFRNENGCWIETSSTDKFTLRQQESFSEHAKVSIFPKVRDQLKEYDY